MLYSSGKHKKVKKQPNQEAMGKHKLNNTKRDKIFLPFTNIQKKRITKVVLSVFFAIKIIKKKLIIYYNKVWSTFLSSNFVFKIHIFKLGS